MSWCAGARLLFRFTTAGGADTSLPGCCADCDSAKSASGPPKCAPRDGTPCSGRLVITRLPADKADESRARLRRQQGKKATAQVLYWAGFIMLFTTVLQTRLDAIAVARLYCLRWQVELQFKRDKSVGGLDLLPNRRDENVKAWLLAKLLLSELSRRILSATPSTTRPASPAKKRAPQPGPVADRPAFRGHGDDLWECAAIAWSLLRSAFLPIDWTNLPEFARRFRAHLARLRRRDDQGQVAAFLAFLENADCRTFG